MAALLCDMDCVYRSKRLLRKWKSKNGRKWYGCSRDYIVVRRIFDSDGDIKSVAGEKNMAICMFYEPVKRGKCGNRRK